MKYRYGFAVFLIAFIIQTTLLQHIAIWGIAPNLLLMLVVAFSFLFDEKHGLIYGLVFGLLQDLFFSQVIGISALCYFLIALSVGAIKRYLYRDNVLSVVFIAIGGTLGYNILYWSLSKLFEGVHGFLYMMARQPFSIVLNMLLLFAIYWIIVRKVIKYRGFKYM